MPPKNGKVSDIQRTRMSASAKDRWQNPSNHKKVDLVCDQCGTKYSEFPSHISSKSKKNFCSQKCYYESMQSRVDLLCQYCGKSFSVWPTAHNQKFCSRECYDSDHSIGKHAHKIDISCSFCGKRVDRFPSQIKQRENYFCSTSCHDKYRHKFGTMSGENNPLWKGGISFEPYCPKFNESLKEEVRLKFDRICFLCNKTEKDNGRKLDIHHVDYDKSQGCSGKKWCVIPLCASCHRKTGHNRWYWFNLLRDYWIYEYINFIEWCGNY